MFFCLYNFSSVTGNQEGLCGKPLNHPCIPPSSDQKPNFILPHEEKGNRKHRILITAIVVVVVVVLASMLALLFIHFRRRQHAQPVLAEAAQAQPQNISAVSTSEAKSIDVAAGKSKKNEDEGFSFVGNEREEFDLQDLLRAPAEVLGSGSFGSTYKAMISNGPVVVVKRFKHMKSVGKQQFFEHMKRLGRLTHPNLLPLIAFYHGKEEKLLVYDFVENGSLASHLHGMAWHGHLLLILHLSHMKSYNNIVYDYRLCRILILGL